MPVISYNAKSSLIRRLGALLSGDSRVMSKLTDEHIGILVDEMEGSDE
ncbi:hypothetical protein [Pseudoalteromonas phage PHS21]|nr:hypothetical protein [Pseudoalteromonas phage PHS21]